MRTVIQGWSGLGFVVRLAITVLTGVTWAVYSLQAILVHPDYWDPVTAADFFAVYVYSAAWLLTAASLLTLREVARPALARSSSAILVVAAACAVAGVANGVEDGLGLTGFGPLYVIGALVSGFGMFVIAAMFWPSPGRRLTFVPAVGGVAMVTVVIGGGVLGLVAWLGFGVILIRERSSPRVSPSAA
jgi:hypothetical protein